MQPLRACARSRVLAGILAGLLAVGLPVLCRAADPWLFVNDVHLDPLAHDPRPASFDRDTNTALLESALAEMKRVAPNPPVIVMAGDFLGHRFRAADALPTMVALARRFDRAFPHAQFVMALGNEDADCGDYAIATSSGFLRAVATAWAPLVNRNGAAPDFVRTFSRDGFYTARLPLDGVRAVVVDNAFWSPFYRNLCGPRGDATPATLGELERALAPSSTQRRWLVMHIPPGIDASSTVRLTKHLAIVPFLRPEPRDRILTLAADPARHVELIATGHVHRFSYRIVDPTGAHPVPILISPAISPIYDNNPSFLTADVAPNGTIRNLEEHSRVRGHWRDVGGLQSLGVSEFSARALLALQRRLEREPDLRETLQALYLGGTRWREYGEGNWRSYWCAATELRSTAFRGCVDEGGFSFLTRRGVFVVGAALAAGAIGLAAVVALGVLVIRRRRQHRLQR